MINNPTLKVDNWEKSYERKENYIYYPKEEVVKFLNRFVRKKTGTGEFRDILVKSEKLKGLDFGCGIGRQAILLEEFNIEGYGTDISAVAITEAYNLAKWFGYDMTGRFQTVHGTQLPFADKYFDVGISDSVLDSMYFSLAKTYLQELDRVVGGLLYISLISGDSVAEGYSEDVEVANRHEEGTIQSFYNLEKIKELISETGWKIKWLNHLREEDIISKLINARYHIVLEK